MPVLRPRSIGAGLVIKAGRIPQLSPEISRSPVIAADYNKDGLGDLAVHIVGELLVFTGVGEGTLSPGVGLNRYYWQQNDSRTPSPPQRS